MCNKSFAGILNSAVCPSNTLDGSYHNFDMVIAYAQHAFFMQNAYDPHADRFANLTPAKYRQVMNRAMELIERDMMIAFEQATSEIQDACNDKG